MPRVGRHLEGRESPTHSSQTEPQWSGPWSVHWNLWWLKACVGDQCVLYLLHYFFLSSPAVAALPTVFCSAVSYPIKTSAFYKTKHVKPLLLFIWVPLLLQNMANVPWRMYPCHLSLNYLLVETQSLPSFAKLPPACHSCPLCSASLLPPLPIQTHGGLQGIHSISFVLFCLLKYTLKSLSHQFSSFLLTFSFSIYSLWLSLLCKRRAPAASLHHNYHTCGH